MLASAADAAGRVHARRPRVAVLLTGDELIEPGEPMRPGAIRNSNAYAVPPLAATAGAEVSLVEHVGDDRAATRAAVERRSTRDRRR